MSKTWRWCINDTLSWRNFVVIRYRLCKEQDLQQSLIVDDLVSDPSDAASHEIVETVC